MISVEHAKEKCKDDISKIENYDKAIADKDNMWVCHHRLELTLEGEFAHSADELIKMGMYYKRPYFELIFLTYKEHSKLHNGTSYHKEKMSKLNKSGITGMFGKKHTDETKRKIGKSNSGNTYAKGKAKSEFGRKYFEHYGYLTSENEKQYHKEKKLFYKTGKCSWE